MMPVPRFLLPALLAMSLSTAGLAQTLPPPSATDPVALRIMAGSPPAADRRVTRANVLKYPNARWAFHNMRAVFPTHAIGSSLAQSRLPRSRTMLGDIPFGDTNGASTSLSEWRDATYTDALIVLYRGQVVYEYYMPGMTADQPHALWSMSKSILGLLTLQEIEAGRLDPAARVGTLVPELSGSAWAQVSVQQLLDMQSGVGYRENFADRQSDLYRYLFATGLIDAPPGAAVQTAVTDYLPLVRPGAGPGTSFAYKSVDSEVLGWVLTRVTGEPVSDLVSGKLWGPLGAENDGYYLIDPAGTDIASVGVNATLRDIARLGEALANKGRIGARRAFTADLASTVAAGVDRDIFARSAHAQARAGYGYHNQWWIPAGEDGVIEAKGLFGQHLYVNPRRHIVIAKFSSHPIADTSFTHAADQAAFAAIVASLSGRTSE